MAIFDSMNTSLAEVKRCFTNHVGLFAAGEALGGDVAGLHGEVKSRSVHWPLLNLRQGF